MILSMRGTNLTLFPALLLLLASSLAAASGGHGDGENGHGGGHGGDNAFEFGTPAPDTDADRTIKIAAHDSMRFEPSDVTVEAGEVIRFVVRNTGQVLHSFTLGTPKYQQQHQQEMQGMAMSKMASHMDDSSNGIVIRPGETRTLTWRFRQNGTVEFVCHIPGHYAAGMKGQVEIE